MVAGERLRYRQTVPTPQSAAVAKAEQHAETLAPSRRARHPHAVRIATEIKHVRLHSQWSSYTSCNLRTLCAAFEWLYTPPRRRQRRLANHGLEHASTAGMIIEEAGHIMNEADTRISGVDEAVPGLLRILMKAKVA